MLSFTDKVKSVKVKVPEKVKIYIDKILKKEIKYFEDKFKIDIDFFADPQIIIPEYSIKLLNKDKITINKVENINKIEGFEDNTQVKEVKKIITKKNILNKKPFSKKIKKDTNKKVVDKKTTDKKDKKKIPRTLWVRRKKKAA